MDNDILDWLVLSALPGIGCALARRLLDTFVTPGNILQAGGAVAKVHGIGKQLTSLLNDHAELDRIRHWAMLEHERASAGDISIRPFTDPLFPPLLQTIQDSPLLLYTRGNLHAFEQPSVAIIGSRAATSYGKRISSTLARDLSRSGITIVSGMAVGIDGHAHQGCLQAEGKTIAVLGCGVDVVYPRSHDTLYKSICRNGLVLSEYPLGTRPEGFRFPARNRIISGLSIATVVVEATRKSGSLITARLALDQGRDVFAVPGRIDSVKSEGTHRLIQQGAQLVQSATDIIQELEISSSLKKPADTAATTNHLKEMDTNELCILHFLDAYPTDIDTLAEQTKIPAPALQGLLLQLEMKGQIRQLPGQQYELVC